MRESGDAPALTSAVPRSVRGFTHPSGGGGVKKSQEGNSSCLTCSRQGVSHWRIYHACRIQSRIASLRLAVADSKRDYALADCDMSQSSTARYDAHRCHCVAFMHGRPGDTRRAHVHNAPYYCVWLVSHGRRSTSHGQSTPNTRCAALRGLVSDMDSWSTGHACGEASRV